MAVTERITAIEPGGAVNLEVRESPQASAPSRLRADPRYYQIVALSGLLAYGVLALHFDANFARLAAPLLGAVLTQWACTRLYRLPHFDAKSALISGLSLCLLLRTNEPAWAFVAAMIAVASKFVLRVDNKHVFNPTNFAIVVMLLVSDAVWVSPGQWGSAAYFGFLLACLGGLVVQRSSRSDVTLAFFVSYAALLFARALWLGDPMQIPLRQLQSGALLIFGFFMISDPRTTPDSRWGRIAFAFLVAAGALFIQFGLYRTNGLLWSLVALSTLVPVLNRLAPGRRFEWTRPLIASNVFVSPRKEFAVNRIRTILLGCSLLLVAQAGAAWGFCGFYVAKADAGLFNEASQVVLVRDGDRTVVTMVNDFQGDPTEFAMVVPVPTVLQRQQIHVADMALIDHLDAYTSPRLVEYFDPDPCTVRYRKEMSSRASDAAAPMAVTEGREDDKVTVEATYTVGEYDIVILSARESDGLQRWLTQNGYKLPKKAAKVLAGYVKQDMRFFVAKVNLKEQEALGFSTLRPLQIAFESPKFMLPIRLGTVNARGPQDLIVYTLTRNGRVETTNYRTVKLPTGMDLPAFVKDEFADFYRDMFSEQVRRESMRTVFTEYAWDMAWCDPCAADPLSRDELRELGVFWLAPDSKPQYRNRILPSGNGPQKVFVTRLHVRYDAEHFPEDLMFQETGDRQNFQGRYVLRHPWKGDRQCAEALAYNEQLRQRQRNEAQQLATLTGWDLSKIHQRMDLALHTEEQGDSWWSRLWSK